jgi:hypothetical protein
MIEYNTVKFYRGLQDDIPIYERVPSAEVDAAWEELYACKKISLPHSHIHNYCRLRCRIARPEIGSHENDKFYMACSPRGGELRHCLRGFPPAALSCSSRIYFPRFLADNKMSSGHASPKFASRLQLHCKVKGTPAALHRRDQAGAHVFRRYQSHCVAVVG